MLILTGYPRKFIRTDIYKAQEAKSINDGASASDDDNIKIKPIEKKVNVISYHIYEIVRMIKLCILVTTLYETMFSKQTYFIIMAVLVLDEVGRLGLMQYLKKPQFR